MEGWNKGKERFGDVPTKRTDGMIYNGDFNVDEMTDEDFEHYERNYEDSLIVDINNRINDFLGADDELDELFFQVGDLIIENGSASTALIQRTFRIGYNRAARLLDYLETVGIISESFGSVPRDLLISSYEWDAIKASVKSSLLSMKHDENIMQNEILLKADEQKNCRT